MAGTDPGRDDRHGDAGGAAALRLAARALGGAGRCGVAPSAGRSSATASRCSSRGRPSPVVFVVLLAGWVAARLLPDAAARSWAWRSWHAPLPWVAWAVELPLDPVNLTPAHPRLIDLNAASWNGIRLGDESTRLRRRLGPPPVIDLDPESGDEVWRYGRQAFAHRHGPTVDGDRGHRPRCPDGRRGRARRQPRDRAPCLPLAAVLAR